MVKEERKTAVPEGLSDVSTTVLTKQPVYASLCVVIMWLLLKYTILTICNLKKKSLSPQYTVCEPKCNKKSFPKRKTRVGSYKVLLFAEHTGWNSSDSWSEFFLLGVI